VLAAAVCGTDLLPYAAMPGSEVGVPMGHEFVGVVRDCGEQVSRAKTGDLVVAAWRYADNTCHYCRKGLHTSCPAGGRYGYDGVDGGQGEAVRVPHADGTLVRLPTAADPALLPLLLTLADAYTTGHHGAVTAGVSAHTTARSSGTGRSGCARATWTRS